MPHETELRRVVVADDERDIAGLLTMNLEMEGYQVETVYDGSAALDAVRSSLPDFVLLDVMMPKMNGLEVLAALKADDGLKNIPVILLSAKAQAGDVQAGLDRGANAYVTKPFDPLDLLDRVGTLVKKK